MSAERRDDFRASIERLCDEYVDAVVSEGALQMPVLGHWCLLMTYDDVQDPTVLASNRICRKNQATHETAGLLWLNLQELTRPEDD
jgi:hypothetical protein